MLEDCYVIGMDDVATRLGRNVRTLREARAMTQAQMAKLADVPRATWANLESGAANPTLAVLDRVASAFQVTIEELIAAPRSEARRYPRAEVPEKLRGGARIRRRCPPRTRRGRSRPAGGTTGRPMMSWINPRWVNGQRCATRLLASQ